MDTFVEYFRQLDQRFVTVLAAVLVLWVFAKTFRWLVKFALVVALIVVVVWKVPAAQDVLVALIK